MPRSACTSSSAREVPSWTRQAAAVLVVGAFEHLRDAEHRVVLEHSGLMLGLSVSPAISACSTCSE